MQHGDFIVGEHFYTATGEWMCTDKGTRVITAIPVTPDNEHNRVGPPYSIQELVFDEYDFGRCYMKPLGVIT